jgi:RND family efflux transporter MFP subunit
MKRWMVLPILVLMLVVGFWHAWKSHGQAPGENVGMSAGSPPKLTPEAAPTPKEPQKAKALPMVMTETVTPVAISKTIDLTGSVAATRVARMASPGEGPVLNCTVREGDRVKRGDRILSIGRNKAAQAQVAASQAALKEQEQDLKRTEQLVRSGAIPGSQLDTIQSKFENAKAQLAKAREGADDYSVVAPWDGIVSKVLVKDGDYVAPRAALVEIFDPGSLVIRFAVPEVQATDVRESMAVTVQLDAHPGKVFQGKINRVYPELDPRMRARTVEAVLGEPVQLIPGMFARLQVLVKDIPDAITVPSEAVIVTPKGDRLAFVVQDGRALRRKVETGLEEAGRVQIVKGIQAGEQVIVSGYEKLKDGAEVQVRSGAAQ